MLLIFWDSVGGKFIEVILRCNEENVCTLLNSKAEAHCWRTKCNLLVTIITSCKNEFNKLIMNYLKYFLFVCLNLFWWTLLLNLRGMKVTPWPFSPNCSHLSHICTPSPWFAFFIRIVFKPLIIFIDICIFPILLHYVSFSNEEIKT